MCCMSDGQSVLHYKKHVFHVCECLITLTVILFLYISKTATISLRLQNFVFESDIKHLSC